MFLSALTGVARRAPVSAQQQQQLNGRTMTATFYVVDVSAHTAPIHAGPRIEVAADSRTALNGITDGSLLKFSSSVLREAN